MGFGLERVVRTEGVLIGWDVGRMCLVRIERCRVHVGLVGIRFVSVIAPSIRVREQRKVVLVGSHGLRWVILEGGHGDRSLHSTTRD